MLSYDWLKIVGLAVALILFWNLLFTMTATRVRPSQRFTVFNHHANMSFTDKLYNHLSGAVNGDTFSYEVIEMTTNDLSTSGEFQQTLVDSRLQTDEGDVMFIPKLLDPSSAYKDENGKTQYADTYLQRFLKGYRFYLEDLDPDKAGGYFYDLKEYLNGYYGDYKNADGLDEAKIERDFRARAKKNKDKRFKTEEQLAQGAKKDVERIRKYRDAWIKMEGFLESGLIVLEQVDAIDGEGNAVYSGKFALNLCPSDDAMCRKFGEYVYYGETIVDAEGKETIRYTAKDMCVMFFQTVGTETGFEYESLLYVVDIIETCLGA